MRWGVSSVAHVFNWAGLREYVAKVAEVDEVGRKIGQIAEVDWVSSLCSKVFLHSHRTLHVSSKYAGMRCWA